MNVQDAAADTLKDYQQAMKETAKGATELETSERFKGMETLKDAAQGKPVESDALRQAADQLKEMKPQDKEAATKSSNLKQLASVQDEMGGPKRPEPEKENKGQMVDESKRRTPNPMPEHSGNTEFDTKGVETDRQTQERLAKANAGKENPGNFPDERHKRTSSLPTTDQETKLDDKGLESPEQANARLQKPDQGQTHGKQDDTPKLPKALEERLASSGLKLEEKQSGPTENKGHFADDRHKKDPWSEPGATNGKEARSNDTSAVEKAANALKNSGVQQGTATQHAGGNNKAATQDRTR